MSAAVQTTPPEGWPRPKLSEGPPDPREGVLIEVARRIALTARSLTAERLLAKRDDARANRESAYGPDKDAG